MKKLENNDLQEIEAGSLCFYGGVLGVVSLLGGPITAITVNLVVAAYCVGYK